MWRLGELANGEIGFFPIARSQVSLLGYFVVLRNYSVQSTEEEYSSTSQALFIYEEVSS